jgi:hypothetical protein
MVDKDINCDEPELMGRALSARTKSVGPDKDSVGLSAKSRSRSPVRTEKGASALSMKIISCRS